jgi:mannose-6-phosphate isomerase-like protein (cupin superfamily)
MTFGTTKDKFWVEALPTEHGSTFTGRTFSRFHLAGDGGGVPTVCEIWATPEHAVEAHAHDAAELLYVLGGIIELNGRKLAVNDVVFIPRGDSYSARVLSDEGCHVLRIELPGDGRSAEVSEYEARVWNGALTAKGYPKL